jgi:hypothetical protein
MVTVVDARLREEAERFALRFSCEDCAHQERNGECSLGFPPEPRTSEALRRQPSLRFCKTFELA